MWRTRMSSGGDKTQTVTSNQAPWSGQQGYLTDVFQKAQDNFNTNSPKEYYPNATYVPFSGQTEQALQGFEQRATNGSPVTAAAQNQNLATSRGDYLSAGNPYFSGMMDTVANDLRPRMDAQFASAGRYGSGAHQQATASALADAGSRMAYQNYGDERSRQMQAGAMAPDLADVDYTNLQQLAGVGAAREGKAGEVLGDQINRYNFNQNAYDDALRQYASLVAGGQFGGSSVQQVPTSSNPLLTGLGAAASGAGILGNLFGAGGVFR